MLDLDILARKSKHFDESPRLLTQSSSGSQGAVDVVPGLVFDSGTSPDPFVNFGLPGEGDSMQLDRPDEEMDILVGDFELDEYGNITELDAPTLPVAPHSDADANNIPGPIDPTRQSSAAPVSPLLNSLHS
jgi:hypothetical protein